MEEERKDSGVGVVEPKSLQLKLPEGGFKLRTGGVLKRIDVAYEECGAIRPERDNVIFICHALTGDAHVAGIRPGETKPSGWWEGMVGPGRAIDTNRYHIICANVLGGCSGTTGPSSINPDTGKPYGSTFPRYDFSDGGEPFFLQALHFTREDLDKARHRPGEVRQFNPPAPRREVCLSLDCRQTGLGCNNCGPKPLPGYRFPVEKTTWRIICSPVSKPLQTASH